MDSQIISLNEELQDIRNKYNELREGNASKNYLNDDTPMCERHEVNYIQSEDYLNRISHNSFSRQSHHDPNNSEKLLTELNNDLKKDLKNFKRCVRSMRTIHDKLYDRDDDKTTCVLPKKKSKPINQEPQSKTDFEKLMTKFLDDQRVSNMLFKNNVNDMIIKMKQNEKNFQTKIKNMERKIDEWSKSQNISLEQTYKTEPPPHPQAHTEHVNVVFSGSEMSDDSLKILKYAPPPIIVNNKIEKDRPIKTSKKNYYVVEIKEYPFREYIPKIPFPQALRVDHSHLNHLGAGVNVIPKSMFEHLKLAQLKKTDLLVEMADMTKRSPIRIVENVVVKINKFLFPSDFAVMDMLNTRNESMILGRPFLATIHAEINVFNKEISFGIKGDGITFDMNKKIHNFTTPIGKFYMINSTPNNKYTFHTSSDASSRVEKTNDLHNENNYCNQEQGRS
nr:hypothetical protein [Tanacetum cinerariifolium]